MAKTTKKRSPTPAPHPATDTEPTRTTSNRPDEMPADVLEFITAIDDYKRIHQRPFPTWSEVFDVLKSLGYARHR